MTGEVVDKVRTRYAKLRRDLQAKGTRSARRKLKRISGREQRFVRDVNHRVSKSLVGTASSTDRGLAIEDLKGIRERTRVRKARRYRHHSWAFAQLREFLSYKCAKAGVHLGVVDPRNTSRTCNECGHCEKANRQGERFRCRSCGHTEEADINGARNIRAAVNQPNGLLANVACVAFSTHNYKPAALAAGS